MFSFSVFATIRDKANILPLFKFAALLTHAMAMSIISAWPPCVARMSFAKTPAQRSSCPGALPRNVAARARSKPQAANKTAQVPLLSVHISMSLKPTCDLYKCFKVASATVHLQTRMMARAVLYLLYAPYYRVHAAFLSSG